MVLKLFFDISTSFRFTKDQCECTLHSEAPPCLSRQDIKQCPLQGDELQVWSLNLDIFWLRVLAHARNSFVVVNILYIYVQFAQFFWFIIFLKSRHGYVWNLVCLTKLYLDQSKARGWSRLVHICRKFRLKTKKISIQNSHFKLC